MKSLFEQLYYRIWTFLRPVDTSMKPSRFSRLLTMVRDVAAIVAILWAFVLFTFPSAQRMSDKQFGISAFYFMGEYRICLKKSDAAATPPSGQGLASTYCWVQFENTERLCTPQSGERSACVSPIAAGSDETELWKNAEFVKEKGYQYGYEIQKLRFYHDDWRANASVRKQYAEDWDFRQANSAATGLLDVSGDLVIVEAPASGAEKAQLGREQVDWGPAGAAATFQKGRVLTIAESKDCLFVERTRQTGALSKTTEYPNNIYARMVKVSCL